MACISQSTKAIVITAEVLGFVVLIAALFVVYRIFVVRYVKDRERDGEPDEEKAINAPASLRQTSSNVYKPLPTQPPILPPFRPQRPPEHLLPSQQGRTLRPQSYQSNSLSPDISETRPMMAHTYLERRV